MLKNIPNLILLSIEMKVYFILLYINITQSLKKKKRNKGEVYTEILTISLRYNLQLHYKK